MPKRDEITHESVVGKPAPAAQALKGMQRIEAEQQRRFDVRKESQGRSAEAIQPFQAAFGERTGDPLAQAVKSFAELEKSQAGGRPAAPPSTPKEQERIFHGSVGITRVPPYNYQWTWNARDNNSALANVSATANNGRESFVLYNNGVSAHAWGATAVGIYYRPLVANGIAHLFANPAFSYYWFTYSVLDSSHSDGWLGLYVGQYTLAGDLDRVAVNQQISLWNDDSWWSGAGGHSGSNSGYPLSAWFTVDSAHWYAMWVWAGGSVYGDGWSTFWGSAAYSSLSVAVPSINIVIY